MLKKRKVLAGEVMPEFDSGIDNMAADSKIFVDKSLEIAHYIFMLMELKGLKQKDLAEKMGKSEAEVSKILSGMHNLTLRSISKLEAALDETIICTPEKHEMLLPFGLLNKKLEGVKGALQDSKERKINYGNGAIVVKMNKEKQTKTLCVNEAV